MKIIGKNRIEKRVRKICGAVFASLLILLVPSMTFAVTGFPSIVAYQGTLNNSSGTPLGSSSGTTYYFKFSLWDSETVGAGSRLWPTADPNSHAVLVKSGIFTENIGDTANGYPDQLTYNFNLPNSVYLQTEVSSDNVTFETVSPRQRVSANATAFGTSTPIGLSSLSVAATTTSSYGLSIQGLVGQVASLLRIIDSTGNNLFSVNGSGGLFASSTLNVAGLATFGNASTTQIGSTGSSYFATLGGSVGIGTTSPVKLLSVGGASALAGAVSVGAGYGGTVPPTNGMIIEGVVGIGTNDPDLSSALHVNGGVAMSSNSLLKFDGAIGTSGMRFNTTGNLTEFFSYPDGGFQFYQGGTPLVRIQSTGNVGIGTTSPGSLLSVGDTSGINFSTATSTFSSTGGVNLTSGCFAIGGICLTGGGSSLSGTAGQLAYFSGVDTAMGTSSVFISEIGNVGIGSTSPNNKLDVGGNFYVSGTGFFGGAITATSTLAIQGAITSTATSANTFPYASTTAITSSGYAYLATLGGYVGIGTTSPLAKLHVASANEALRLDGGATSGSYMVFTRDGDTNTKQIGHAVAVLGSGSVAANALTVRGDAGIQLVNSSSGTNGMTIVSGNAGMGSTTPWGRFAITGADTSTTNALAIADSANTPRMVVQNSGNVGIGTTSPASRLSVAGNVLFDSNTVSFASTSATGLVFSNQISATTTIPTNKVYSWTIATSTTAVPIISIDTTGSRATTTIGGAGSGNVTIGDSTSPTNLVFGSSASILGGGTSTITLGQTGDKFNFAVNLGVGTSTAFSSLTVASGNVGAFNGALCADNNGTAKCYASLTAGTVYGDASSFAASDIAENYSAGESGIEAGDIVMLAGTLSAEEVAKRDRDIAGLNAQFNGSIPTPILKSLSIAVVKATTSRKIFGVVSTNPGVLLADATGSELETELKPIALSGRIPVKVNNEGGAILAGDRITLSSIYGVGKKATTSGETIGVALESMHGESGMIEVFVGPRDYINPLQFVIDSFGNVGIGGFDGLTASTSPEYKLHVLGDVAATSFVNISTRDAKKDIEYFNDEEKHGVIDKIRNMKVAEYRYNGESESAPLRLGLIAEEAPPEVLSASGKGVDVYKLSTFILAGVQEVLTRIESVDLRLARLEELVSNNQSIISGNAQSTPEISAGYESVLNYLSGLGSKITAGVANFSRVVANSLTVGSSEKPAGITIYDEVTKEPYCFTIANGQPVTRAGVCPISSESSSTSTVTSSDSSTSSTSATSTPPTITLMGNNPAEVELGGTFTDPGATGTDSQGNSLMPDIFLNSVNTSIVGQYEVIWRVHDTIMNYATSTRIVNVVDPYAVASSTTSTDIATSTAGQI